ncbi:MAG: hypothetical protein ACMXYE_01450 [Candidatus Woesearchaeota archaeon]
MTRIEIHTAKEKTREKRDTKTAPNAHSLKKRKLPNRTSNKSKKNQSNSRINTLTQVSNSIFLSIFPLLQLIFWKMVHPFKVFGAKRWYLLVGYDALFVIALILLGSFIERTLTQGVISLGQSFLIILAMVGILLVIYALPKFFFYRDINKTVPFQTIVWKHGTGGFLILLTVGIIWAVLYNSIQFIVHEAYIENVKLVMRYLMLFVMYKLFLEFQLASITKPLIRSLIISFRNFFTKMGTVLYTNATLFILAYVAYNFLRYLFRLYYNVSPRDPLELHEIAEQIAPGIIFVLFVLILSMNKAIIFSLSHTLFTGKR